MRPEIQRARQFRSHMSPQEVLLWSRLKRLRERGYRFRRQAPFRGYYLDFACFARRLVVEVDGSQHNEDLQADHDLVRDKILARYGFTALRFTAGNVERDLSSVMDQIVQALESGPSLNGEGRLAEGERGGESRTSFDSQSGPHSPTLAATQPVPPH